MSEQYTATLNTTVGTFTITELYEVGSERQKMVDGVACADFSELPLLVEANDDVTVSDAAAEVAMMAGVATACPQTWRGQKLKGVSKQERYNRRWKIVCSYSSAEKSRSAAPRYDKSVISLDFSGQQQLMTECLTTVAGYSVTGDYPETPNLIGWDGRQLHGVPVDFAVMKVNYRFLKRKAEMTTSYYTNIYNLFNTVNDAEFKQFAAGSLRMCGATLNEREDGDFEITFTFEADKTHTYENLGLITTPIITPPHHYLDVKYRIVSESFGERKMEVPVAELAWVRKIYADADFSLLQIP